MTSNNPIQIWAFADVDDNLVTTTRTCPEDGAEPVAYDGKGTTAWLTLRQKAFVGMLNMGARIVLTTARSSDGVSRVNLPTSGYAIASMGGVIRMPDGSAEPRFHELMQRYCVPGKQLLENLLLLMERACAEASIDARCRTVEDAGLSLYLSVKHNKRNLEELAALKDVLERALPPDWTLHFNGNFLAAMPPWISKRIAVRWFLDNIASPNALAIGLGDSLTDLSFMGECDFAVMPTVSQNFSHLMGGQG